MRRLLCFLLCFILLPLPAQAAEVPKYVALTFDDGPSGQITAKLLDGLAARGVKASLVFTSTTEDILPPYRAGKPLL